MPKLDNLRHEAACQAYAAGRNQRDAYTEAGYRYTGSAATALFARPDVIARIREIVEQRYADEDRRRNIAVQKAGIDEAWVIERLRFLTDVSLRGQPVLDDKGVQIPGQYSGKRDGPTAVRCLALAARIVGIDINRHEVGQPGAFSHLSDDKLQAEIDSMAKQIGYTPAQLSKAVRTQH